MHDTAGGLVTLIDVNPDRCDNRVRDGVLKRSLMGHGDGYARRGTRKHSNVYHRPCPLSMYRQRVKIRA